VQNSDVCDAGPFLKAGLLRWLVSPSPFGQRHRLGVIGYREPNDGHRFTDRDALHVDDGEDDVRSLDPDLYDRMRSMAACSKRPLSAREVFRALPENTVRFDRALSFDRLVRDDRAHRVVRRQRWFHEAMVAVTPCSFVFLDSDGGTDGDDPVRLAGDHVDVDTTVSEIGRLLDRGQSVLTHQRVIAPSGSTEREQLAQASMRSVYDTLDVGPTVFTHETSSFVRLFMLIPHHRHRADLNARVGALQMSRWGEELRLFRWHPAHVGV